MFQALDLEDTFTLPPLYTDTHWPPPPPPPKKRTRYVRFGEGEGGGGGKMYLKHCDKSGKLQIKVLSVMWPGKRSLPAMLQRDAYTKMHYYCKWKL